MRRPNSVAASSLILALMFLVTGSQSATLTRSNQTHPEWSRYTARNEEFSVLLPELPAMNTSVETVKVGTNRRIRVLGAYMLGTLAFGGRMNFWQVLSTLFYAAVPIIVIQKLLGLVLLYLKSPDDIHPILGQETLVQDNLGVLFSPANHPVIFVLATAIGILSFYGLWLKATGLKNAGTRVSSNTAWGVAITFWVIGTLLITGLTALFPSFIS